MIKIIFLFLFLIVSIDASPCATKYNCTAVRGKETPAFTDLNCTLPSPNINMIITALDVFESDGTTLKKYFETNETVCAVLEWMNKGAENFAKVEGLDTNYTKNITLNIGHQDTNNYGAAYGGLNINIDSDPIMENDLWSDQKGYSDGNLFSKGMKYFLVHEFFHYAQDMTVNNPFPSNYDPKFYKKHEWVNEGTARMFEGIVYEEEVKSLYLEPGYINFLGKTYIAETLKDGIKTNAKKNGKNEAYKTFAFWKLVRNKCELNMLDMLGYPNKKNIKIEYNTI